MVGFGMTRRGGRSTANEPGLNAVINAEVPATCLVGKAWDFHVETAFGSFRTAPSYEKQAKDYEARQRQQGDSQ